MTATNGMPPVHPGEILRDEMDERGLSTDAWPKGSVSRQPGNHHP